MLAVTLTIGTLVSIMFFFVGGVVGWLARENTWVNQPIYTHPEMFDENGNVLPFSFWGNFYTPGITKNCIFQGFCEKMTFSFRGPSGIPDFGGYSDTDSQVKGKVSIDSWSCCC